MAIDILQSIVGGITASLVWFMAGGVLYMNPFVAKIYKDARKSPGLKKWTNVPKYLSFQLIRTNYLSLSLSTGQSGVL